MESLGHYAAGSLPAEQFSKPGLQPVFGSVHVGEGFVTSSVLSCSLASQAAGSAAART